LPVVRSSAAASEPAWTGASIEPRLFATDMVPRITISASIGTDIIRNPAMVATSWLTASIPAQLARFTLPAATALVWLASRSMMNEWMRT
jgi:hypothetical protein